MTDIVTHHSHLPNKIELTNVGLVIHGDLSWEEAEEAAKSLQLAGRCWQWWWGDFANKAEGQFGEEYAQLVDEYDENTLRQAQYVASKIPIEVRRPELSFAHHHAVASLDYAEQRELLDKAVEGGWGRDDLRKAVATFKNELKNGSEPKVDSELSARGQSDAVGTSAQDDEPEEGVETVDWTAELEEANAEVERLLGQIDRLVTDDKDEEIRKLAQENDQLHGRIQEQIRHIMKLEDYEAYAKGELAKIRELLEVEKTSEIRPAIETLKTQAVELPF